MPLFENSGIHGEEGPMAATANVLNDVF